MNNIGYYVSRLRNTLKAVKEDAFITDRYLYSLILKHGKALLRRDNERKKTRNIRSLFKIYPCVDLIEVSTIDTCCSGVSTNCKIMRTKDKLPSIMDSSRGPMISFVSIIDNSEYLQPTTSKLFVSISNSRNFKYNKTKYYWYLDGHIYLPNAMYEGVNIEAIWEDNIAYLQCGTEEEKCEGMQQQESAIPDYLYSEIENMILQELGVMMQVPNDTQDDKQSNIRP